MDQIYNPSEMIYQDPTFLKFYKDILMTKTMIEE